MKRPEIGTTMYHVLEHLYYIPERTGPIMEYVVREASVTGFFEGGYTEVVLVGTSASGHRTPYYYKLSNIGKTLFYTPQAAAEYAKRKTEDHERAWGWLGAPDIPMRRPWTELLFQKQQSNLKG